jgi:hypothetical protein
MRRRTESWKKKTTERGYLVLVASFFFSILLSIHNLFAFVTGILLGTGKLKNAEFRLLRDDGGMM